MYIYTLSKSQVSEMLHDISHTITLEEREANFSGKLYSINLLDVLRGFTILDLCSEGTWTSTSPYDTAKGVAC